MDVWVVVGFGSQVYGVYTTQRKAEIRREELERDGTGTLDPVHSYLNKETEPNETQESE